MNTPHNPREQAIARNIIKQIQSGEVKMRPHWHFTLLAVLGAISMAVATIMSVYLVNLVVFKLRLVSSDRPRYGMQANFNYFASNFPWLAFVFGLVSFGLFVWLIRKKDFSYRFGRWLLVATVMLSVVVGIVLAFTRFNDHLENFGPMRGIYGQHFQAGQGQNQDSSTQQQNGDRTMKQRRDSQPQ